MIYRVHKWLAVTAGVALVIWLISGIIMVMPGLFFAPVRQPAQALLDLREIVMSPTEAAAGLTSGFGKPLRAKTLALLRIRDAVVYRITLEDGASELINAKSGDRFEITPKIAEEIVRDNFPTQTSILQIERIDQRDLNYPWGPLPVYRLVLSDEPTTFYHVALRDGAVQRSDRWSRIQAAIEGFHTFQPLKLLIKEDAVRKWVLVLLSFVAIAAALTGYYLAISQRRR